MELPSANKNMQKTLDQAKEKMNKALDALSHNLGQIRTGRANPKMLDGIEVEYYGCPTPMNQLGSISVVEGTQLVIKPYDRSILKGIEKAIQAANKNIVRIPLTDNRTIAHDLIGEAGAAKVVLKPASAGTGVIAGGAVRAVLELAGIHDILSKSLGSRTKNNMANATLNALRQLKTPEHVAELRGKTVEEILG